MALAPPCCISLTTDAKYFLPAVVSAIQARRFAAPEKADVAIFGFRIETSARALFAEVCERDNLVLHFVEVEVVEGLASLVGIANLSADVHAAPVPRFRPAH